MSPKPTIKGSPSKFFKQDSNAFRTVVKLGKTKPGQYEQGEIQENIDQYAALTSLGDVHKEGISNIRDILGKYKNPSSQYPEMKGYGVVGQYGDGKTHFLTQIHKLLQDENEIICPQGMNLLTLDPFNFTSNPADIVEALRERVKAQVGPDAADKISHVQDDETQEVINELISGGLSQEKAEATFQDREVQARQGQDAGIAFSEGCKTIVNEELFDAVVLLMDEIEGIVRGQDVSFEDLDKYREFFDEIDSKTPVVMIMTAPRDQWNRFEQVHAAMMDRMFGATPRQHVRLRPLNENELIETWKRRRERYLVREGVQLPQIDNSEIFPLHNTTLRAIYQIADRADSNRTAIKLMKDGYDLFFQRDEIQWVTPGDVFLTTDALTAGDGGFFVRDQFNQIKKFDEMGVLSSIAATLHTGISRTELLEVLNLDGDTLDDRLDHLRENGWLTRLENDGTLNYQLTIGKINSLLNEEDATTSGELKRVVENTMSNVSVDEEFLYRNLCEILKDTDPFKSDLVSGSHNENNHYFVVESTYGNFHDRRLLVAVGNQSPEKLEEIRVEEVAELVVTVDYGDYDYTSQRILNINPESFKKKWSYEVENLEYTLQKWICGYRQLKSELPQGAQALMSGIRTKVVGHTLNIDEYEFGKEISRQLSSVYPNYPGPVERMNSNAKDAYYNAIDQGLSGQELTWKKVKEIGKAQNKNSVESYMTDWVEYDLATEINSSSLKTVELQISKSESLILESINNEEGKEIQLDKLVDHMNMEGYPVVDVKAFLEILKERGKVRVEDSRIQLTSDSSHEAKVYFEAVNEVAEWLTSSEFPKSFHTRAIPNRKEIIRLQSVCENKVEEIKDQINEGVSNPIENLIESIQELHEATILAIDEFDTTEYAQKLMKTSQEIEGIKELKPDTNYSSTQFFTEVSFLQSKASDLANGARRFLEKELDANNDSNIFESMQTVHDKFLPEYQKIGVYKTYKTEESVREVMKKFSAIRPDPKPIKKAVEAVETFDDRIDQCKRISNICVEVLDKFKEIEEVDLEKYKVDKNMELSEDAAEVIELFKVAGDQFVVAAEKIDRISFSGVSKSGIASIESAIKKANDSYSKAQRKRDQVNNDVHRRAGEITDKVQKIRADVRKLHSQPNWTILSEIQTASARTLGQEWKEEFIDFSDSVENSAPNVLEVRPSTVSDLDMLNENYEEFMSKAEKFSTFVDDLLEIEMDYYQSEKDELPPGRLKEIDELRSKPVDGEPVSKIETILQRIERISDALEVNRIPIEERIKKMVRSRQNVTPDDITNEIPDEDYLESEKEVVSALNSLISNGDVELKFDKQVVVK